MRLALAGVGLGLSAVTIVGGTRQLLDSMRARMGIAADLAELGRLRDASERAAAAGHHAIGNDGDPSWHVNAILCKPLFFKALAAAKARLASEQASSAGFSARMHIVGDPTPPDFFALCASLLWGLPCEDALATPGRLVDPAEVHGLGFALRSLDGPAAGALVDLLRSLAATPLVERPDGKVTPAGLSALEHSTVIPSLIQFARDVEAERAAAADPEGVHRVHAVKLPVHWDDALAACAAVAGALGLWVVPAAMLALVTPPDEWGVVAGSLMALGVRQPLGEYTLDNRECRDPTIVIVASWDVATEGVMGPPDGSWSPACPLPRSGARGALPGRAWTRKYRPTAPHAPFVVTGPGRDGAVMPPTMTTDAMLARYLTRRRARRLLARLGNSPRPLVGAALEHCQGFGGRYAQLDTVTISNAINRGWLRGGAVEGWANFAGDAVFQLREDAMAALVGGADPHAPNVLSALGEAIARAVPPPVEGMEVEAFAESEILPFLQHLRAILHLRAVATPVTAAGATPAELAGGTDVVSDSAEGVFKMITAPGLVRLELLKLQRLRDGQREDLLTPTPPGAVLMAAAVFIGLGVFCVATTYGLTRMLPWGRIEEWVEAAHPRGGAVVSPLAVGAAHVAALAAAVFFGMSTTWVLLGILSPGMGTPSALWRVATSVDDFERHAARPLHKAWAIATRGAAAWEADLRAAAAVVDASQTACEAQLRVWGLRALAARLRAACEAPALAPVDVFELLDAVTEACGAPVTVEAAPGDAVPQGPPPAGTRYVVEEGVVPDEVAPLVEALLARPVDEASPGVPALEGAVPVGELLRRTLAGRGEGGPGLLGDAPGGRAKARVRGAQRPAATDAAPPTPGEGASDPDTDPTGGAGGGWEEVPPREGRDMRSVQRLLASHGWRLVRRSKHVVYRRVVAAPVGVASPGAGEGGGGAGKGKGKGKGKGAPTPVMEQTFVASSTPSDVRTWRNMAARLRRLQRDAHDMGLTRVVGEEA